MAENEGVWRTLPDRDDVHVRVTSLPAACGGGVLVRLDHGEVWILIDADRPAVERRAILAHELEHLDRGSARWPGAPESWDAVVAREERRVDDRVAGRLVPEQELQAFVRRCLSIDEYVTALDVAEHFEVPVDVAERACRRAG